MLNGPVGAFCGCVGIGCQIPVKIVTAQGGKKYEPVIIGGNIHVQNMPALPGHQNGTQRDIKTAEKKIIESFPNPNQSMPNYCVTTTLPVAAVSLRFPFKSISTNLKSKVSFSPLMP